MKPRNLQSEIISRPTTSIEDSLVPFKHKHTVTSIHNPIKVGIEVK